LLVIVAAAALLLAALAIFFQRRYHRQRAALPSGTLLSADHAQQPCPVLVSTRYGLKGRPDAVIRTTDGLFVPVERKHSRAPRRPHDSDIIQAAAYCLLIEEHYGQTPPFMRIDYDGTWFDVPFTPNQRDWVVRVSARLRAVRTHDTCRRSHNAPAKCRHCAQRPNCDQAL
jgi:CRISPR-associated exonuclease Cas4